MRKVISLVLALVLCLGCVSVMADEAVNVKTGLSYVIDLSSSKDGKAQANFVLTAVTVDDNGVIDAVAIDYVQAKVSFDETGKLTTDKSVAVQSKNELGDGYGMRPASSISAEWNEQAAAFAAYCVGKTAEELTNMGVDENGKATDADLIASCTLAVNEFLPGVLDAVAKAEHIGAKKGDVLKLTQVTSLAKSKDAAEGAEGQAHAYNHVAAITLNGETITSCIIDAAQAVVKFDATGKITSDIATPVQSKNVLKEGYGMKAISPIGKEWYEQAAGFCAYATGKTLAEITGMELDGGYATGTDLVATCTISVTEMVELFAKAAN
ncbi:MAG: hypothetical protein E7333_05325 [Clostridiales bacterium]|nr:hypothetical protein [Clostridiales bacterium]